MIYGYVRVSSEEQAKQGLSIQIQIDELIHRDIIRENIFVDEGKSAGINDEDFTIIKNPTQWGILFNRNKRPAFSKLLDILVIGDEIVFLNYSRISRSIAFLETFAMDCKKRKIKLTPIQGDNSEIIRQITSVLGQWEREETRKRITAIMIGIYTKGGFPYKGVYGYNKNIKLESGKLKYPNQPESSLIINEKKAEIVRECFKTAIQTKETGNKSLYRDACKRLKITPDKYYNIIRNKTYMGMTHLTEIDWKKTDLIPAIITEEEFYKVNNEKNSH